MPLELKGPLTEDQIEYWEYRLQCAERAKEFALRMLGRVTIEGTE